LIMILPPETHMRSQSSSMDACSEDVGVLADAIMKNRPVPYVSEGSETV